MSKRRGSRSPNPSRREPPAGRASASAGPISSELKNAGERWQWLPFFALAALLFLVACQPISGDGLWWETSRGRAVWEGQLRPSASLLSLESATEADWLGGLPLYAVYQTLGADGWMLFRFALLAVAAGCLWKRRSSGVWASPPHLILFGLTAIALSNSLGLQPIFYDLVGVAVLPLWISYRCGGATERDSTDEPVRTLSSRRTLAGLLVAFVLWSNLAPGFAFGGLLCLVALFDVWKRQAISSTWLLAFATAIAVGGAGNPRGVFAWIDSLQTLLPFLQNPTYVLAGTPWGSMLQNVWGWQELYFLALTGTWILDLLVSRDTNGRDTNQRRASGFDLLSFAVVQWFAWASLQNLPLAILWMTGNLAFRWHGQAAWPTAMRFGIPAIVLLAAAWSSGLLASFGWGVDQRQDYRLLRNSLQTTHPHGTAFADQTRSAAMLAWVLPELPAPLAGQAPMQLQDIPLRAVRQGRLEQHLQLLSDLKRNRLMRYWRTDGSAGGYWLTFAQRNTTLLCLSNTNLDVIRGLEETPWKPLSLDSAVIPFAIAGDEAYVQQMIQILQNRETIEHRYWQYEPSQSSGSEFDRDRFGFVLQPITPAAIFEQAEVFRAMHLHYAALRVLAVGRARFPDDPSLQASFLQCQRELADQERIDAGSVSWFRFLAAAPAERNHLQAGDSSYHWQDSVEHPSRPDDIPAPAEPLRALVDVYLQAGAPGMLRASSQLAYDDASAQVLYGCLCAALESGEYDLADQLIVQLRKQALASPIRELVLAREIEYRPQNFNDPPAADSVGHQGTE